MIGYVQLSAGALVGAVVTFGAFHAYTSFVTIPAIQSQTRELVAAEARERAFNLIEKRNDDNAEISALDMRNLCTELGGRWVPERESCD